MLTRCLFLINFLLFSSLIYSQDAPKPHVELKLLKKESWVNEKKYRVFDAIYKVEFFGFPKNEEIIVSSREIAKSQEFVKVDSFIISTDAYGFELFEHQDGRCTKNEGIGVMGYVPGECMEYQFTTKLGRVLAEGIIFAEPIHAFSQSGQLELTAMLLHDQPTTYGLTFSGLNTEDILKIKIIDENKVYESEIEYIPNKPLKITPHVENPPYWDGKAKIEIKIKDDCFSFQLPWRKNLGKDADRMMFFL